MPFDYIRICARMHSVATRRTPSNKLQEPKKLSLAERLLFVADQRCLCLFASVLPILVVSGLEFPGLCLGLKDRSFPSSINKLENLERVLNIQRFNTASHKRFGAKPHSRSFATSNTGISPKSVMIVIMMLGTC